MPDDNYKTERVEDVVLPRQLQDMLGLLRRLITRNSCTELRMTSSGYVRVTHNIGHPDQVLHHEEEPLDVKLLLSTIEMAELEEVCKDGPSALVSAMRLAAAKNMYVVGLLASSEKEVKPVFGVSWEVPLRTVVGSTAVEFIGLQTAFAPDVLDAYALLFMCGMTRDAPLSESTLAIRAVL